MNEQLQQLLIELANKFDTTTEHLWHVLIKQAFIDSLTGCMYIAVSMVLIVEAFKFIKRKSKEWVNVDAVSVVWTVYCIMTFIIFIDIMCGFPMVLAGFFNPEYWALKQILPN